MRESSTTFIQQATTVYLTLVRCYSYPACTWLAACMESVAWSTILRWSFRSVRKPSIRTKALIEHSWCYTYKAPVSYCLMLAIQCTCLRVLVLYLLRYLWPRVLDHVSNAATLSTNHSKVGYIIIISAYLLSVQLLIGKDVGIVRPAMCVTV